jgi:hypothetical protein
MKHADMKMDKKMAKKAVGMHEAQLHGGKKSNLEALKKGGKVMKYDEGGSVEKGLGRFSQARKLRTDGAKNTDLEIGPAMGRRILGDVDDKFFAPGIGKLKEGMDEVKARAAKPKGPSYKRKSESTDMKKGGGVKCMARGGGIEVRGKTRGRMC